MDQSVETSSVVSESEQIGDSIESDNASDISSSPNSPGGSEYAHCSEDRAQESEEEEDEQTNLENSQEIEQTQSDSHDDNASSVNMDSDNESLGNEEQEGDDKEQSEKDIDETLDCKTEQVEPEVPEINIVSEDNDSNSPSHSVDESGEALDVSEAHSENEKAEEEECHDDEMSVVNKTEEDDVENETVVAKSIHSGSSDEEDEQEVELKKDAPEESERLKIDEQHTKNSDGEASDGEKEDVGDLIANIFGPSDEEEEFEGFDQKDIDAVRKKRENFMKTNTVLSGSEDSTGEKSEDEAKFDSEDKVGGQLNDDKEQSTEINTEGIEVESVLKDVEQDGDAILPVSDDSDEEGSSKLREGFLSDFDIMMQKKKEESSRRRKRKDVDIINDSDDLIAEIISQMRQAADEDRLLNKQKKTATKKLKILQLVLSQLKKQDLKMPFLDQGVLNVMADWLSPLPDRSLPNLQIREGMIKQLIEFPIIDQSLLKSSGVGRALMYLYKHPKETKENKERAGKLIKQWARPIFNVTTDYHSLTKEEREQRDFDHIPKKRKLLDQGSSAEESGAKKDIDKALNETDKKLRPGDKGWIGRARVPAPSTKDYVVRPKWNVEMELGRGSSKKPLNRYEKHIRTLQEKKRMTKSQRAVTISIEGRKMAI